MQGYIGYNQVKNDLQQHQTTQSPEKNEWKLNLALQFVEMNAKQDRIQSAVQLLFHTVVTVQEKLEVYIQSSFSSSSDYYEVTKDSTKL